MVFQPNSLMKKTEDIIWDEVRSWAANPKKIFEHINNNRQDNVLDEGQIEDLLEEIKTTVLGKKKY